MFILDHCFGRLGLQPGGPMVLPCVKEAHHYSHCGRTQSYLTSQQLEDRQKGPGSNIPSMCVK